MQGKGSMSSSSFSTDAGRDNPASSLPLPPLPPFSFPSLLSSSRLKRVHGPIRKAGCIEGQSAGINDKKSKQENEDEELPKQNPEAPVLIRSSRLT